MSDTFKDRKAGVTGPKAEAFLSSGKGKSSNNGLKASPKWGRNFRTIVDWQRVDLSRRDSNLTPGRSKMKATRYMAHHTDPSFRSLQAACSIVEPLR